LQDRSNNERLNARLRTEYTAAIERLFAAAERYRIDARCAEMHAQFDNAADHIGVASRNGAFTREATAEWIRRLDAARARACPASNSPPPILAIPDRRTGDAGPTQRDRGAVALSLSGGYLSMQIPRTSIGFTADGPPPAPERAAGTSTRRPDGWQIRAGVEGPVGGLILGGAISYGEASGSNNFVIDPAAGRRTGNVFGALSPANSSGNSTPFGATGSTSIDTSQFKVTFSATRDREWLRSRRPEPTRNPLANALRFGLVFDLDYERLERTHRGEIAGSGTSGGASFQYSQTRDQRIREDYITAGLSGELRAPVGRSVQVAARAGAGVYYVTTRLRSVEINTANFGPVSDRNFRIDIGDGDDGFGMMGVSELEFSLALGPDISLVVMGDFEYRSRVGVVRNPRNGDAVFFDGETTGLGRSHMWRYGVQAGVKIGFR
jgi:hypothetical protein